MSLLGLRAGIVVATLLGTVAMLLGTVAAHGMETPADVPGWRNIRWGMPLSEALALFEDVRVIQERKTEIAGCYFQYAVPITVLDEEWDAWLCEDRDDQTIVAINIEKGYRGGFFFDSKLTSSGILGGLFADMSDEFGPAHRYWGNCFNVLGNPTQQFRWYFPTTMITFVYRDTIANWAMLRFEPANGRPEFGPGVCRVAPVDLLDGG